MCGICGKLNTTDVHQPGALSGMLKLLEHRGPDHGGTHVLDDCAFGSRRLAIIDLSERANQPMVSPNGEVMAVHNGEIYNHKELRRLLEREGAEFRSTTDTEVILNGYRHWGEQVVERLQGMYAFAVWDATKGRFFAARDPLGKKPFAWHFDRGKLWFASEIEALVAGLPHRPEIDLDAVEAFLRYRYVPGNMSVYKGIKKLPPGHLLIFERGSDSRPTVKEFWAPKYRAEIETTPAAARDKLKTLLVQSILKRMESDVPVAALLSGGLDSSLIVAVAAQELGVRWKTLHARFRHDEAGESRYAEQVAAHCRTEHEEIEVSPEHLDSLPKVLRFFSEPYADDSALPSFFVYEALKKRATVAITGDGGDEVFGGYLHARGYYWRDVLGRHGSLAVCANAVSRLVPGYRRYDSLRHLVGFGRYLGLEPEEAFALTRSTAWNEDARRLLQGAAESDPYLQRSFRSAVGETDFEKMFIADIITTLPDAYLLKVDRMSMAVSVEARCPLLDLDLMNAAHTVPPRILMPRGRPKRLAQQMAEAYLPRELIYRPKRGFSLPLAGFLRQMSPDLITGIVNQTGSFAHQYFDRPLLEEQIQAFYNGDSYLSYKLWSILCLEIWYRLHYSRDIGPTASLQDLQ